MRGKKAKALRKSVGVKGSDAEYVQQTSKGLAEGSTAGTMARLKPETLRHQYKLFKKMIGRGDVTLPPLPEFERRLNAHLAAEAEANKPESAIKTYTDEDLKKLEDDGLAAARLKVMQDINNSRE